MDVIDGRWIAARLTGRRGEKKQLAEAMGIDLPKLSKVLSGERGVQPHELPRLLAWFGEGDGMAEAQAAYAAAQPAGPGSADLMRLLAPAVVALAAWTLTADVPLAAMRAGDLLVVELGDTAAPGEMVLVNRQHQDGFRAELRRYLPPLLVALDLNEPRQGLPAEGSFEVAIIGTVRAVVRGWQPKDVQ